VGEMSLSKFIISTGTNLTMAFRAVSSRRINGVNRAAR